MLLVVIAALFGVCANLAPGQAQSSAPVSAQPGTVNTVIRVQSRLVVVRAMVADKKTWRNGLSTAGKKCALGAEETFLHLAATEPYLPPDCEGLFIRGLTTSDFHLTVDGAEQKIANVASASEGLRIRDNLGFHIEFSHSPMGRWSTIDAPAPLYITGDAALLARNRYDISFVPNEETGCHKIQVNVDRRASIVASRKEYCDRESPADILNGSEFGIQLARDLASVKTDEIPLALQAAAFEGIKNGGRIQIALEFPTESLAREWGQHWNLEATIGVSGVIYTRDGNPVARFSDFACCTPYSDGALFGMQGTTRDQFMAMASAIGVPPSYISAIQALSEKGSLPTRYETQMDLSPGDYNLRVVLGDGKNFGRAEAHLTVEIPDDTKLALSSVMLCNHYRDAHVAEVETKAANFAPQYVPMVSKGVEFSPAGKTTFSSSDTLIAYFEIYKPQLASGAESGIQAHLKITDAKSGGLVKEFPAVDAATYEQAGSLTIPIAREVPISELSEGAYRLEVQASDSAGHSTPWQAAAFSIK